MSFTEDILNPILNFVSEKPLAAATMVTTTVVVVEGVHCVMRNGKPVPVSNAKQPKAKKKNKKKGIKY